MRGERGCTGPCCEGMSEAVRVRKSKEGDERKEGLNWTLL